MADYTTQISVRPGIQAEQNNIRQLAIRVKGDEVPGVMDSGTHDIAVLPAGAAVVGAKVVALSNASGGVATLKVGSASVGGSMTAANLAAGKVCVQVPNGGTQTYSSDTQKLSLNVTSAFTALDTLVVVDYIPVPEITERG